MGCWFMLSFGFNHPQMMPVGGVAYNQKPAG